MDIALWSSVIADLIATLFLVFFAVVLAKISLQFGPPEYACIMVFALTLVAGISGESIVKGVIATCLGFLFATVGLDPMYGSLRYTFDLVTLLNGVNIMVLLIGLFAISEVLMQSVIKENNVKKKSISS